MNNSGLVILIQRSSIILLGFVTTILIATYLTPHQQGYYYAIGSLISSYNLIELGLPILLVQLSAKFYHRKNVAVFKKSQNIQFLNFIRWLSKYLLVISLLIFCSFIPLGYLYFNLAYPNEFHIWFKPWICIVFITALSVPINSMLAVIEGIGKVKLVYGLRIAVSMLSALLIWFFIYIEKALYGPGVMCFSLCLVAYPLFFMKYRNAIKNALFFRVSHTFNAGKLVWPIHKKSILMLIASYIFYFSPNLIIFYFSKPDAGKLGISIVIASSIVSLASSSLQSNVSEMSKLYHINKKNESNKIFRNEYIKTMRYTFIGFLSFLLALYLIDFTNLYFVKDKILSMQNFILLFINFSLMQALTSLSYFFRLRDKDPASRLYFSANILSLLVSIWTCSFFGIKGLLITNLFFMLVLCGPLLFKLKRQAHVDFI